MKTVITQQLTTILFLALGFSSCSKERTFGEDSITGGSTESLERILSYTPKSTDPNCRICNGGEKIYDLRDLQKKTKLREGTSYFGTLENGTRVMVSVKNGLVTGWQVADKSGKTIQPQSTERRKYPTGPGSVAFYRFCMYLDGLYTCFILIAV